MYILLPNFEKRGGLIPVMVMENVFNAPLMLAYTDQTCFLETIKTGEAVYFSTSRNGRWKKGETSGHIQRVRRVLIDCDGDALIYYVDQTGPACHTNAKSCFFRTIGGNQTYPQVGQVKPLEIIEVEEVRVGFDLVTQQSL